MEIKITYEQLRSFFLNYAVWFALPFFAIYLVDMTSVIFFVLQITLQLLLVVEFISFIVGCCYGGLSSFVPSFDVKQLTKLRWNKFFPFFRWGFNLCSWLMEEEIND